MRGEHGGEELDERVGRKKMIKGLRVRKDQRRGRRIKTRATRHQKGGEKIRSGMKIK